MHVKYKHNGEIVDYIHQSKDDLMNNKIFGGSYQFKQTKHQYPTSCQ